MKTDNVSLILIGAKNIAQYGGYESFINRLIKEHKNKKNIQYYVYCKANGKDAMDISKLSNTTKISDTEFLYYNARCFLLHVPQIGAAQAIIYDLHALKEACKLIKEKHLENPIIYIMACRIGPFMPYYARQIHKLGGKVFLNPDGHEWMRKKWSIPVRKYWKWSEKLMVKYSDLCVCDSKNIETYIQNNYAVYHPNTTFIAYGADISPSPLTDQDSQFVSWLDEHNLIPFQFYMCCGRFVPENNFEIMIREFINSKTNKDFVIITTDNSKLLTRLERQYHFKEDKRIKFVGTVYDQKLLKKIRENAYGYIHGHSVGGTNPSLLEALGSTKLNLLLRVSFNMEVAENAALYWERQVGSLSDLIEQADALHAEEINRYEIQAKKRIQEAYSWTFIAQKYEELVLQY